MSVRALPSSLKHVTPPKQQRDVPVVQIPGDQMDVQLSIDPSNQQHLIAASNDVGKGVRVYESLDGGATWAGGNLTVGPAPFDRWASDPSVAFDRYGKAYLSFLAFETRAEEPEHRAVVAVATKPASASSWGDAIVVDAFKPVDRPMTTTDSARGSRFQGNVYTAWGQQTSPGEQHDLMLATSVDGKVFKPVKVSQAPGVNIGPMMSVGPDGALYVVWRNMRPGIPQTPQDFATGSRFLFAKSTDGGKSFSITDKPIISSASLGASFPALDVDRSIGEHSGTLYAVYSDFDFSTQPESDGSPTRRLFVTTSKDGGGTWSSPSALPTEKGSLPDVPRIAVDAFDGSVHATWEERREVGRGQFEMNVFAATSRDGGKTFDTPRRLNSEPSKFDGTTNPGDYIGIASDGGKTHIAWGDLRPGNEGMDIFSTTLEERLD